MGTTPIEKQGGACDALFVGSHGLYEIFLLDRDDANVAGYHIVDAQKLMEKFPKLSKYVSTRGISRFLLTVEEIFEAVDCQTTHCTSEVWRNVLAQLKEPELPVELIEERMEALQQRLLRLAHGLDPSAGTLIMVETSNLLDFLGLRHHPCSQPLRSLVNDMSKRQMGRLPALANAVKVLAGLRQFIEALYGKGGCPAHEEQWLMAALGTEPEKTWRCEIPDPQEWFFEEDETVQRARAWLSSPGLCHGALETPAAERTAAGHPMEDSKLRPPSSWSRPRRGASAPPRRHAAPRATSWAAEVRRQEAMSDRLKAKAQAEKMPLPCPAAVRRAQQRAKKIQLKQAEEEAQKLEERLYHGQLLAAKTAELLRERDLRRASRAPASSAPARAVGDGVLDGHGETPRCSPEPCVGP